MAERTWARDCLYQGVHKTIAEQSHGLSMTPVYQTAKSYFTTIVNKKQKQSDTKLDGSPKKWCEL